MNTNAERLLARQLKRHDIDTKTLAPNLVALLESVRATYEDFERDRQLLEHAIELSSKEMNESNRKLKESALIATKAATFKSNFLANMSHEIRTPLNGIIGLAEMVKEHSLPDATRQLIELIARSSQGLLSVINDVLDLSKIEAGKLSILARDTNLHRLLHDMRTMFIAALRDKTLECIIEINSNVPEHIHLDDGRLRQVLTNLLGNALKFTPDLGWIIIQASVIEHPVNNSKALSITVSDTGIGISSEHTKTIFDAFSQVNTTETRQYGGTGLGLTISQHLIRSMGGDILVKSRLGLGSSFEIILPLVLAIGTLPSSASTQINHLNADSPSSILDRSSVKILLVEDNVVNQKVALHILTKLGFKPELAENGMIALNAVQQKCFDLILMDCQTPIMSGFEATVAIRKLKDKCHIPIIALTALAMEGDRDKCLAAGMNDYISKPFRRDELESAILRWLGRDGRTTSYTPVVL